MNNPDRSNSEYKMVSRREFLQILSAGLETQSFRFVRLAALNWLAVFPGDLKVSLALAEAQWGEGKTTQAVQILERLVELDPEFVEARRLLVKAYRLAASPLLPAASACLFALGGGSLRAGSSLPEWGVTLYNARKALTQGDLPLADRLLNQAMAQAPDLPLVSVTHVRYAAMAGQPGGVNRLVQAYHNRWTDCLQLKLYLAEAEIEQGDETRAVDLLHQCVSLDAAGQVAFRLWGNDHRYRPLWPEALEIHFDLPIPAAVAGKLGRNWLASGPLVEVQVEPGQPAVPVASPNRQTSSPVEQTDVVSEPSGPREEKWVPQSSPETVRSVAETFERLAKKVKQPDLARSDGRFPVYVILSSRTALEKQFGSQTAAALLDAMRQVSNAISHRPGWGSLVFLPDDVDSVSTFGMQTVETVDPWKIKLALADLDKALAKKGQMIGAVLIGGGPAVIPYHRLPNPTDDMDTDVPSDNPYATLDANYFVPEFPVGRLVSDAGVDAGLLLEQLRTIASYHSGSAKNLPSLSTIVNWLLSFLRSRSSNRRSGGFGYTAEVWKKASEVVFKGLGGEKDGLISSPPTGTSTFPVEKLHAVDLGYFNLHGIADGPDWYGQKDTSGNTPGPDYPVAISPGNITSNGNRPQMVFTEACYGAHVDGKMEQEALALRFIATGVRTFVGSTTISYGSVAAPLIGADLLGYNYWKSLKEGLTVGEALMQAKIALAREMTQRQGFLDGEDQKTLISFVLFGDPLLGYEPSVQTKKTVLRAQEHAPVKMICDRMESTQGMQPVSQKILNEVKEAVREYLPGLGVEEIVVSRQHAECDGTHHRCPTAEVMQKSAATLKTGGVVVTVSKKIQEAQYVHHKYARVTLNAKGKVIKLAVSR